MNALLAGPWRYRHFIWTSIRNEFLSRIVGSRLGLIWMILHPLSQVLVYALILSVILSARLPGIESRFGYAAFITSGILAWTLFSEILVRCLNMYIDNANLLKKIVFPRICLPIIITGSAILNSSLLFLAALIVFAAIGHLPGAAVLWLPLLLVINVALAAGLGLLLGVINVFIRDIGQLVVVALQFGFWLTPIIYSAEIAPEPFRTLLALNPLYFVVTGYQNALIFNTAPNLLGLAWVGGLSATLLLCAFGLFRRAGPDMVDML